MVDRSEEEDPVGKVYDARLVRRMSGYVRPYWRPLAISVVLLTCVAGLEIVGPWIVRYAIDNQIAQGRTDRLGLLVALYLGSLAAIFLLRYGLTLLMTYIGQRVMMALRMALFSHLQRMSIAFFDRNPVGRLTTRLTNDVATLEMVISEGIIEIITNLMLVSVIAVALLVLDWRLALAMYVFLPFGIFTVRYFASAQREAHREQRAWLARINAFLNENISGMATVQLFNRQKENLHRFDGRNQGLLGASLRSIAAYAVFEPTVIMFNALTTATILWYGGGRVVQGALTLGTLVVFIQLMQRVYWPLRDLADRYTTMQQAMASSERIFSLLDEPEEIIDASSPRHLVDVKGKVEFRNVWFAYDEENWVLRDVSFVINPGEKVAIVGVTGAGKSTIISLLSGFYDVQRGTILVDDVPVDQISQRELRRHVGIVLQDAFLFTDTVEENIRLRDSSITSAQVREAAHVIGADVFITQLPEAYSTLLAERGANLSVGQKQLLALTRVAAFNPEIVLVMDEATASIDPLTEAAIQRGIRQVTSGRTSIIIAHRLNTVRDVDWIVVMHQGQVAEVGTHKDLLVQRDIYYRLYKLQYDEQESFRTGG